MHFRFATIFTLGFIATANAAMIKEKRLFGPAPTPSIPAGLEATDSSCFDGGGKLKEDEAVRDTSASADTDTFSSSS